MKLFETTYYVRAVIVADDYGKASTLAVEQFRQIVNDNDYEGKDIEELPVNHGWDLDYVPYGDNPDNLTISQLRQRKVA